LRTGPYLSIEFLHGIEGKVIGVVENPVLSDQKLMPVTIDHFEKGYFMDISDQVVNRSSNPSSFNTIPNGSEKGAGEYFKGRP
jgi:hypothetical protein